MTLLTLAVKNVRHQARNYAAFFLGSTFAVWMFYLYGTLHFHPGILASDLHEIIPVLLAAAQGVVAVFSVLFVLHAHQSFLQARQRELGILTLLGLLPRQISRIIHYENLIMGLAATVTGITLGTVCSKLFFLGFGPALGLKSPLAFHFSPEALVLTVVVFTAIFSVISLLGRRTLRRLSVVEIFRSALRPRTLPRFSWLLALFCVVSLGAAYVLALTVTEANILTLALPLMGLTLLGTYLLFTQGSVALLGWLKRNPRFYYRGTNLMTISQLFYKMKDNARILFMVTILSTMVLVLIGTFYGGYSRAGAIAEQDFPVHLFLIGEPEGVGPDRVDAVLAQHGVQVGARVVMDTLLVNAEIATERRANYGWDNVAVFPQSAANGWLQQITAYAPVNVKPGHALIFNTDATYPIDKTVHISAMPEMASESVVTLPVEQVINHRVVNMTRHASVAILVDDATFATLQDQMGAEAATILTGYRLLDWKQVGPAYDQLKQESQTGDIFKGGRNPWLLSGTITSYRAYLENILLLLFLTSFIGILFFLASGNMLYFKLLTDLNEERRQYQSLYKIGVQVKEVARIVSIQTAILFFTPLVVATLHALFLVPIFARLLSLSLWQPLTIVVAVYATLYMGYYLVTRRTYVRALLTK